MRIAGWRLLALAMGLLLLFATGPAAQAQDTLELGFPAEFRSVPDGGKIIVRLDLPLLRRLILNVDDVRDARISLPVPDPQKPGIKVEGVPEAAVEQKGNAVLIRGLGGWIRRSLESGEPACEITLAVPSNAVFPLARAKDGPACSLVLADHPKASLFGQQPKLAPGVYATAKEGRLYYGDKRLRIWGTLGSGSPDRLRKMGFNGWRMWPTLEKAYTAESVAAGAFPASQKGDGSPLDVFDRQWADFKKDGIFLMATQLTGMMPVSLLVADDSFVSGGDDWEAWREAVQTKGLRWERLCFVDERLMKARKQHIVNFLNHTNPYTGKRYAEDEAAVIWELGNEVGFVKQVLDGNYEQWPEFFRSSLKNRWNDWLKHRYSANGPLQKAWSSSDELGHISLGPSLKESARFPKARGDDFVRFVIELADFRLEELKSLARAQAPAGVGVAVAPFSFDTMYRPSIPWLYSVTRGDVANFGMYFWDLQSTLQSPPSAYVMDNHTVDGKITVIYETNQSRPNPFRAEYPYKLAALASWQDWDAVFFHYWGARDITSDEQFLIKPMLYQTKEHYWNAVHHEMDSPMTSAMAVAGQMFLNHAIDAAPHPAIYRVGAPGIFSYRFANGIAMARDTFERGSRIRFEPEKDFDLETDGRRSDKPLTEGIRAGEQIFWDWPNGRLVIDAPAAKAYIGPVQPDAVPFRDGMVLSGLNTPWVAFGMAGANGQALDGPCKAFVSAVFDARNLGFQMDWKVGGGPVEQALAIQNRGAAPVSVDRVDYSLSFPAERKWTLRAYDFALRAIAEGSGASNIVRFRNEAGGLPDVVGNGHSQEAWVSTLELSGPHQAAAAVADANTGAKLPLTMGGTSKSETSEASLAGIWNPLPGLRWGDGYALAHRKLRDANARFESISPLIAGDEAGSVTVTWSKVGVLFESQADINVFFEEGAMKRIVATFVQPPDLRTVIAEYERIFGNPVEKKVTDLQYEQSSVRWIVKGAPMNLTILVTEAQGTMKIVYELVSNNRP